METPPPGTPGNASAVAPARPSPLTLPVVLAGVVLVAMSISGTAVALPDIGADLDASGAPPHWVVVGCNLAFASTALFAAGLAASALSASSLALDVARVVSGAGGAGVMAAEERSWPPSTRAGSPPGTSRRTAPCVRLRP
ncbi:hypothetical protein NE857_30020 [Nocardiopsis exhalans]|uniref:MFS transporter n=1 Tax=Nocardiopsis exhalans TaxID=163604 RepID=A0ABY5D8Q0_9ACTN|nr:hypothetical protein [Nocardiopsis exhalans]USY19438.1 hypothetical protein NE857_30020 [Nocardiopsis exhalans]